MRTSRKRHWGFGLIEILVTLGVLSVGIVGVTVLHSTVTKQSTENKSRAEALAIAQSRLEDMRNYTGDIDSLAEFNAAFPTSSSFGNSATITGTNASFTREEQIGASGDLRTVTVRVTWSDPDGDSQAVSLNTRLSYIPPRSIGDTALEAAASVVDAPTGRARLGDGTIPEGAEDSQITDNGDGTRLYDDGGTDLKLATDDDQIVLTLQEACQTEENDCLDFVRIKGRVYIDRTSQSGLAPGEVHVVASDAAFCARYYTDNSGTQVPVTNDTVTTITTGNGTTGNYMIFDYTCYIGGGWHGNIGILLSDGLDNSDKICIGDPVTSNLYAVPIIAARRVYRGMLYKIDPLDDELGRERVSDNNDMVRYYSQGIEDAALLPGDGEEGHDFVIGSFNQNLTDGSNCETQGVMTRADAAVANELGVVEQGGLFKNMPVDFVCLNDGLLDPYDEDVYGHDVGCPYDPSDPPSTSHQIYGTILLDADDTAENDVIAESFGTHTSDGEFNCRADVAEGDPEVVHDGTYYRYDYVCDVYDWGSKWNGFIYADYDATDMECNPNVLSLSNVDGDLQDQDFASCNTGSFAVITGDVTAAGNRRLSTASLGTGNGTCEVLNNGTRYECVTTEYTGPTKSFTITFTPSGGVVCMPATPHNGVYDFIDKPPGEHVQNIRIAANSNGC